MRESTRLSCWALLALELVAVGCRGPSVPVVEREAPEPVPAAPERADGMRPPSGPAITGIVLDGEGLPVAGATVRLLEEESPLPLFVSVNQLDPNASYSREISTTVTSEDGQFRVALPGREEGTPSSVSYVLRVVAPGYHVREEGWDPFRSETELRFSLSPCGEIVGRVVDASGAAVPGAEVRLYRGFTQDAYPVTWDLMTVYRPPAITVRSDAEGRFRLNSGYERNVLWIEAPGFRSEAARDVPLLLGSRRSVSLDVQLGRGLLVTGRVVDPEGRPVVGASVRLLNSRPVYREDQPYVRFRDQETSTDAHGEFQLDGVEDDVRTLWVGHPDFVGARHPFHGPATVEEPLMIELGRGTAIEGRVTNAVSGDPIAAATVTLSSDYALKKVVRTSKDGSYQLRGINPRLRSVPLEARTPGYIPLRRSVEPSGAPVDRLAFALTELATVRGRVTDETGTGIACVSCSVVQLQGDVRMGVGSGRPSSQRDGRFVIRDVPPGYDLYVRLSHSAFLERLVGPVALEPGGTLELEPTPLVRLGIVQGTVRDETGTPVEGCRVRVLGEGDSHPSRAPISPVATDIHGGFRIEGLPPGDYVLKATADEHIDATRTVALTLGQELSGVDLRLERGGVVEGRVVDGDGEPIEGATVLAYDLRRGFQLHEAVTGPDGRFRFQKLRARERVEIRATLDPSLDPSGTKPILAGVGTRDLEIVLERPPQGTSENSPP